MFRGLGLDNEPVIMLMVISIFCHIIYIGRNPINITAISKKQYIFLLLD